MDQSLSKRLDEVIWANNKLIAGAKQFNIRAGSEIFKIPTRSELTSWLATALAGAESIRTIKDFDALLLPALDAELINLVLTGNPDKIELLGRELEVSYRERRAPQVTLELSRDNREWLELADEGVRLPSGQLIEIRLHFDDNTGSVQDSNVLHLKQSATNALNLRQWNNWEYRPVISIPELADEAQLPEIAEVVYGNCVVTGVPLVAYGTTSHRRLYGGRNEWEGEWCRSRAEAEAKLEQAKAEFEKAKVEVRAKSELARAKAEAEEAKARVNAIYGQDYHNTDLDSSLRTQLSDRRYQCPSSLEEVRRYTVETNALVAEVETALVEIARRQAEEEQAAKTGEMLIGFEAWHRRRGKTGNGDGWVIRADGTLRERDSMDGRHDGRYRWERVYKDELALIWSGGWSTCEVAKLPVSGLTTEQLVAVRKIEQEIGVPQGAFGLDPETVAKVEKRLNSIRQAAKKILGQVPESLDYYRVIGPNGIPIEDRALLRRFNGDAIFDQYCDGREALLLKSIPAADGMLEFLGYEKYGQDNIAMRWRELRDDEKAVTAFVRPAISTLPTEHEWTSLGKGWWRCPAGHSEKASKGTTQVICGQCGAVKK